MNATQLGAAGLSPLATGEFAPAFTDVLNPRPSRGQFRTFACFFPFAEKEPEKYAIMRRTHLSAFISVRVMPTEEGNKHRYPYGEEKKPRQLRVCRLRRCAEWLPCKGCEGSGE